MRKIAPFVPFVSMLILALFSACPATLGGGSTPTTDPSSSVSTTHLAPVEQTKLLYADLSLGYETLMKTAQSARANRLISDAGWMQVEHIQQLVRTYAPALSNGLQLWSQTGVKPSTVDSSLQQLQGAVTALNGIVSTAQTPGAGAQP